MKFSIAGSGNMAHHLAVMWGAVGHSLVQVLARNREAGQQLAVLHDAEWINTADKLKTVDCVVLAVNDDAITAVAAALPAEVFAIHTSGFTALDVLPQKRRGVIWPVMSLKKEIPADYSQIHFLAEASGMKEQQQIQEWMRDVTPTLLFTDSKARRVAHLAATISNNFSNALMDMAEHLLKPHQLDVRILLPMMKQYVERLGRHSPDELQTGPAKRYDEHVLQEQLRMLEDRAEMKDVYQALTNYILYKYYGKKL